MYFINQDVISKLFRITDDAERQVDVISSASSGLSARDRFMRGVSKDKSKSDPERDEFTAGFQHSVKAFRNQLDHVQSVLRQTVASPGDESENVGLLMDDVDASSAWGRGVNAANAYLMNRIAETLSEYRVRCTISIK